MHKIWGRRKFLRKWKENGSVPHSRLSGSYLFHYRRKKEDKWSYGLCQVKHCFFTHTHLTRHIETQNSYTFTRAVSRIHANGFFVRAGSHHVNRFFLEGLILFSGRLLLSFHLYVYIVIPIHLVPIHIVLDMITISNLIKLFSTL